MNTSRILSSKGQGNMAMLVITGSDFAGQNLNHLLGYPAGYKAPHFNAAGHLVVTDPKTPIGNTGWTYGDAVEEAIASGATVDLELFPFAAPVTSSSILGNDRKIYFSEEEQFEHETGWSVGDAINEALEAQRDRRLFGRRH